VDELEDQEDHILKVKAAFNKLVTTMRTGNATRTESITYTKDDYEAAKKFFDEDRHREWIYLKEGMTLDEAMEAKRGRGFGGIKEPRLKKLIAAWLDKNPKGGAMVAKTDKTTSSFYEESKRIDTNPGKPYWSKIIEMGARAFSSYLNDKMTEKEWENNYLANATDNEQYGGNYKPYPEGEEREAINSAFDDLFSVIRETKAIRKAIMMENAMEKGGYFSDEGLKELLGETSTGEVAHDLFHVAKGKDGKLGLFITRIFAKKQQDLSRDEVSGGDDVMENVLEPEKPPAIQSEEFGPNGGIAFTEPGPGETDISDRERARRERANQFASNASNELDFILSTWLNGAYTSRVLKNEDDLKNPTWVVFVNKQHTDKIQGAIRQWETKGFVAENHADEGFIQFSVHPLDGDEDGTIKKAVSEVLRSVLA
jgi:hypothetical protein